MTSRYCYCPCTARKIGRRVTLADRFRLWMRRKEKPDLYTVTGFNAPIFPGK